MAEDLSKCNIDVQTDPNNTPECYKEFNVDIKSGVMVGGWPSGTVLKSKPSSSSKTLAKLSTSGHWNDEKLELTGKTKGEWAEVYLIKLKSKPEGCDEQPEEKSRKKGWIKAKDKNKKIIIWQWLYSGLC